MTAIWFVAFLIGKGVRTRRYPALLQVHICKHTFFEPLIASSRIFDAALPFGSPNF